MKGLAGSRQAQMTIPWLRFSIDYVTTEVDDTYNVAVDKEFNQEQVTEISTFPISLVSSLARLIN